MDIGHLLSAGVRHRRAFVSLSAKAQEGGIADLAAVRERFHEARWVRWNLARAVASTAAFGCLAWALVLHGRIPTPP